MFGIFLVSNYFTVSCSQLIFRDNESGNRPEGGSEQRVGESHHDHGEVGVDEGEGEQEMAEQSGGDGDEYVGHIASSLVDEKAKSRGGRGRDEVDQTYKYENVPILYYLDKQDYSRLLELTNQL